MSARFPCPQCGHSITDQDAAGYRILGPGEWDKETGWQPIETAPKDGTDVHVMSTKWLVPVPSYFISREYLEREYGDPDYMEEGWYPSHKFMFDLPEVTIEPTHWQPLPTPPE